MKNGQKLSPRDTPRNIQEVQASKLGDARGTPSSSIKSTRSFFNALYFYCFMHYVLFLEHLYFLFIIFFFFFFFFFYKKNFFLFFFFVGIHPPFFFFFFFFFLFRHAPPV